MGDERLHLDRSSAISSLLGDEYRDKPERYYEAVALAVRDMRAIESLTTEIERRKEKLSSMGLQSSVEYLANDMAIQLIEKYLEEAEKGSGVASVCEIRKRNSHHYYIQRKGRS